MRNDISSKLHPSLLELLSEIVNLVMKEIDSHDMASLASVYESLNIHMRINIY